MPGRYITELSLLQRLALQTSFVLCAAMVFGNWNPERDNNMHISPNGLLARASGAISINSIAELASFD